MVSAGMRLAAAAFVSACTAGAAPHTTLIASRTWAGYVATAAAGSTATFTSVSGTWRQPLAACRRGDGGAAAAIWVGIGGYDAGTDELQQIGSTAGCDRHGNSIDTAWFALLPYPPHRIALKVSPGDTLTGGVTILPTAVRLQLTDRTASWTFTRTIAWGPADTTSAEWIVEPPWNCVFGVCRQARLPNFQTVSFNDLSATADGQTETLANPAWAVASIDLAPPTTHDRTARSGGASAGQLSADGTGFTVTWLAGTYLSTQRIVR